MPGKHAPASPRSFYLSVARAVGGGAAALLVVVFILSVAFGSDGDTPKPKTSRRAVATETADATPTPTEPVETPTQAPRPRRPQRVIVAVFNGTTRTGLARTTGDKIGDEGYRVEEVGDAPNKPIPETVVYFTKRRFRVDARALVEAFPELKRFARAKESTPPSDAELIVVLGDDYEG